MLVTPLKAFSPQTHSTAFPFSSLTIMPPPSFRCSSLFVLVLLFFTQMIFENKPMPPDSGWSWFLSTLSAICVESSPVIRVPAVPALRTVCILFNSIILVDMAFRSALPDCFDLLCELVHAFAMLAKERHNLTFSYSSCCQHFRCCPHYRLMIAVCGAP